MWSRARSNSGEIERQPGCGTRPRGVIRIPVVGANTQPTEGQGGNRHGRGAGAAECGAAEGDAEGAEATDLEAAAGGGHDVTRPPAYGGAGGDGLGRQPPASVHGGPRTDRRPDAA